MRLFRRSNAKRARQRNAIYGQYEAVQSRDNTYLNEFGSGMVYKTMEFALFAVWPMVDEYDAYIADTIENIMLGMDIKFGDSDEPVWACKGYIFELIRLVRATLDSTTDAYSMALLTSEEDTAETESVSYSARAFIAAVLDGSEDDAMQIAVTASTPEGLQSPDDIVPEYLRFITTVLTLVVREWYTQAFPEFAEGVSADANE